MLKLLYFLFVFLSMIAKSLAYFDSGSIGNGWNNSIGIEEGNCIERFNQNYLTTEKNCNFEIKMGNIRNTWINGKYVVKVNLNLPSVYSLKKVLSKCSLNIFNNCVLQSQKSVTQEISAKWSYLKTYSFDDNPAGKKVKVSLFEKVSEYEQNVFVSIPKAIYPSDEFILPLEGKYVITQEFGDTDFSDNHTGIDFGVKREEVLNVSNGKVVYAGKDNTSSSCNNGGLIVRVKHNNGLYSAYFHLNKILVEEGDEIKQGDILGISGNSGSRNCKPLGNHLHFEIRDGISQKEAVNPRDVLKTI